MDGKQLGSLHRPGVPASRVLARWRLAILSAALLFLLIAVSLAQVTATQNAPSGGSQEPAPPSGQTAPLGYAVFYDDFETEQGWVTNPLGTDTATSGTWERADPEPTDSFGPKQLEAHGGTYDLVTGALAGASASEYDVDGGMTSVRSPEIALPPGAWDELNLSFYYYLAHDLNSSGYDYLRIKVLGTETTTLWQVLGRNIDRDAVWSTATASLIDYAGQTIRLLIEAADEGGESLVEAAVDDVMITPIDSTLPTSEATSPAYDSGGTIPVSWTASDSASGLNQTCLWVKPGSDGNWTDTGQCASGTSGAFLSDKPANVFDGGLEKGWAYWNHGGTLDHEIISNDGWSGPHSGSYAARLGDPSYTCEGGVPVGSAWMEQTFTVPSTGVSTLRIWYRIYSQDTFNGSQQDRFEVWINGVRVFMDGNMTTNSCVISPTSEGWEVFDLNVTAYLGQDITLRLENVSGPDSWFNTWTYVDDISLLGLPAFDGTCYFQTVATDNAGNIETGPSGLGDDSTIYDTRAPTTSVSSPEVSSGLSWQVSWSGIDPAPGSGIASYDVQYQIDGGGWQNWLTGTDLTSATFGPSVPVAVAFGHTYSYQVRARDEVGNVGAYSSPAASTYVDYHHVYLPLSLRNYAPLTNGGFEDGWAGWSHGGSLPQMIVTEDKYSGDFSARLGDSSGDCEGGVPQGEAWIERTITVPTSGVSYLRIHYLIVSEDQFSGDKFDRFEIYVNGIRDWMDGDETAQGCDDGPKWGDWESYDVPVTSFQGTNISLKLVNVSADDWFRTWTYVDDIQFVP